jgi:hypothetical protein
VDKKSARRLDLVIKYILVAGKKVPVHVAAGRCDWFWYRSSAACRL